MSALILGLLVDLTPVQRNHLVFEGALFEVVPVVIRPRELARRLVEGGLHVNICSAIAVFCFGILNAHGPCAHGVLRSWWQVQVFKDDFDLAKM